jgi:hypothetical protein
MPIKAEMRWFYPIDWPQLSRHVRFERAGGICQGCGRPHGVIVLAQLGAELGTVAFGVRALHCNGCIDSRNRTPIVLGFRL